jgi:phosphonopyruvate decarboxylase
MKMGALATIGHYAPRNLIHVVLDNEAHESTGGQATVSTTVDFATIALGAGYRHAYAIGGASDLKSALEEIRTLEGPTLVHLKVRIATEQGLGRPTIHPSEVALRLRSWLLDS